MHRHVMDEELVDASGKTMVLEWLLDALFAPGHKVLVFSQFVTMLDIIGVSDPLCVRCVDSLNTVLGFWGVGDRAGHCAASTAQRARWSAVQNWTAPRRASTHQARRAISS
jgi:hypothetical protein